MAFKERELLYFHSLTLKQYKFLRILFRAIKLRKPSVTTKIILFLRANLAERQYLISILNSEYSMYNLSYRDCDNVHFLFKLQRRNENPEKYL